MSVDESLRADDREDLDRLLSLAEEMRDKLDYGLRRLDLLRLMQLLCGSTAVFAIAIGFLLGFDSYRFTSAGVGGIMLLYTLMSQVLIQRLRVRMRPDRRALSEVIGILRETESAVASENDWSPLERAEFRIRLSRFEIGELSDGSFFPIGRL